MLCDNLEEWDGVGGGREVQEQGTYVYLWLIHIVYSRNQHNLVKAITLQFKINLEKEMATHSSIPAWEINPMEGGAWGPTVCGVAKTWT